MTTMFLFAWSAVEVLSQVIPWPKVPPQLRGPGQTSVIEQMIYALYNVTPMPVYVTALAHLRNTRTPSAVRQRKPFVGQAGQALDEIRHFRNLIAHGAASLPKARERQVWQAGSTETGHTALVSTRLVLFSLQMLLACKFAGEMVMRPLWSSDDEDGDGEVPIETLFGSLPFRSESAR